MTVSILMVNPRFPHNVGAAVRAASCFGADAVYWTGDRVSLDVGLGQRLPREERMKAYKDVRMGHLEGIAGVRPLEAMDVSSLSRGPNPCTSSSILRTRFTFLAPKMARCPGASVQPAIVSWSSHRSTA